MKRILSLLLTLFLSIGIIGGTLPVYAVESPLSEGYYQYEETDDGVRITKYTGNELEVVIPSTLGGKPVVTIGEDAFSYNFLNSVVIPEGVITIEHNAFYSCKTLKTVDLPESLVTLNSYSFASCYINNTDSENWQDGILYRRLRLKSRSPRGHQKNCQPSLRISAHVIWLKNRKHYPSQQLSLH